MWTDFLTDVFNIDATRAPAVGQVMLAVTVLLVGLVLSVIFARILGKRLRRGTMNPDAAQIVEKVLFYALLLTIFLTSLHMLEIPITVFAFLGGAIAIGVGFGAQNIINNFISGWILMTERPVRIQDLVEVEGHIGRIESIGARCTRIRRTDGIDMLVPNSAMLERTVVNWTLVDQDIRTTVRVGVRYGAPTDEVARLIRKVVDEHEDILGEPPPVVVFEDFGDNALIFDVYFWCHVHTEMQLRVIRSAVRFTIDQLFRDADIVIAFPQRDVHLDTLEPLDVRVVGDSEPDA